MYTEYARAVDQPAKVSPVARPQPVPPPEARPSQLSVTDIENWLRDPYTIYAKHVLRLFPLEAIDTPPGAADRGTFIHESIGEFTKIFADALPADVALELKAIGSTSSHWRTTRKRARSGGRASCASPTGSKAGSASGAPERARSLPRYRESIRSHSGAPSSFTARADRIERRADGSYAILDYKTGQPPTEPQVRKGWRRSSPWKPRSCAREASPNFRRLGV